MSRKRNEQGYANETMYEILIYIHIKLYFVILI